MKQKLSAFRHSVGLALRIIISVFIIAVIIWKYNDLRNLDVRMIIEASGNLFKACGAVLGVYAMKSVLFVIPASVVYISVGMAFPFLLAALINILGILIEISLSYLVGIILGGDYVKNKVEQTKFGARLLSMHDKNSNLMIFLIRFLPIFPIDLVSLFFGSTRMRFGRYLLLSLGGILPRVILFTLLGDKIYSYIPTKELMTAAMIIIPVALLAWIIRYAIKSGKAEKKAELEAEKKAELETEKTTENVENAEENEEEKVEDSETETVEDSELRSNN